MPPPAHNQRVRLEPLPSFLMVCICYWLNYRGQFLPTNWNTPFSSVHCNQCCLVYFIFLFVVLVVVIINIINIINIFNFWIISLNSTHYSFIF